MVDVIQTAKNAKLASIQALQLSSEIKNKALVAIANILDENKDEIISSNKKDLDNAKDLSL